VAKAVICPICYGKGKVRREDAPTNKEVGIVKSVEWKLCHGCGGRGWVEVSDR